MIFQLASGLLGNVLSKCRTILVIICLLAVGTSESQTVVLKKNKKAKPHVSKTITTRKVSKKFVLKSAVNKPAIEKAVSKSDSKTLFGDKSATGKSAST